jgi:CheY-like chemotaxis protein
MTPKVLLVDDVEMFLELQKMFLKLSSVHALSAKDGVEALRIAKKERPALIFLDLHMPNMNGAECCEQIKADPQLRAIPVVMITTEGKEDDKALCFKAGCDGFMTKPIDRIIYLETARKFLPAIDRRETRIPYRTKVKFRVFGLTLSGDILDISAHGVYVATDYEVDAETVLELVFAIQEENGALIQARGRIAWINRKNDKKKKSYPAGFGVELVAVTEESNRILKYFVETHKHSMK